jgi:short-subunit dehydrogenase
LYLGTILYKYSLPERDLAKWYGRGSWVVITGASRGQGRLLALEFAGRGFNLILIGSARTEEVIKEINLRYPDVKIKFVEKDFGQSVNPEWWTDITALFEGGEYDISVLVNNVGQRSASKPSHVQKDSELSGSIITGTFPQVKLTNLALEHMTRRLVHKPNMHSAVIFNTAQCMHPVMGLSQYFSPEITVPYLAVYEAANAFGFYHANSIIAEYSGQSKYKNIDFLNITPGAVLTENTSGALEKVLFAVPAEKFVKNIIGLMGGNWRGATCAYWGHELAPVLISFAPWVKAKILKDVGSKFLI